MRSFVTEYTSVASSGCTSTHRCGTLPRRYPTGLLYQVQRSGKGDRGSRLGIEENLSCSQVQQGYANASSKRAIDTIECMR